MDFDQHLFNNICENQIDSLEDPFQTDFLQQNEYHNLIATDFDQLPAKK